MASHGVPRVSEGDGAKTEEAKQEEILKIEKYRKLFYSVDRAIERQEFTPETLVLTSKLLKGNPEYYTIWNHRRRILQRLLHSPDLAASDKAAAGAAESILTSDLEFLLPLLIKYPKCYWIWNHRLWLLQQSSVHCPPETAKRFWQLEFGLVGKMLTRDSRNFHGWGYRRTIVGELRKFDIVGSNAPESGISNAKVDTESKKASAPSLTEQEFEYTTKMLRSNLSNFSAWHNRSKLIPKLLEERQANQPARRKMFDAELAKVEDALMIDPYDQSLWFYHQYMITAMDLREGNYFGHFSDSERVEYLRTEVETFKELLGDFDDCKWILQKLIELSMLLRQTVPTNNSVTWAEVEDWLRRLRTLDPTRKGRWDDLAKKLTT